MDIARTHQRCPEPGPTLSAVEPELAHRINGKHLIGHNIWVDWRLLHLRCPSVSPAGVIDRDAGRRLTVAETGYMLEPVHNLARLQIRADAGEDAQRLLNAMYHAVTANADLIVDGQTLPLARPGGTREEDRELRQWVWLQLLNDGIRALTLAVQWDDAVQHAMAHKGIGLHLMEGRRAAIIAHLLHGRLPDAQAMLDESTLTQPWEQQVTSCLSIMCADPGETSVRRHVATMVTQFLDHEPQQGAPTILATETKRLARLKPQLHRRRPPLHERHETF